MILSELDTKYTSCQHYHKELATSNRHALQQSTRLLCLVCHKLRGLTYNELEYVNTYVVGPYHATRSTLTCQIFHLWLFNI